jgi:hypothetical protein
MGERIWFVLADHLGAHCGLSWGIGAALLVLRLWSLLVVLRAVALALHCAWC